MGAYQNEKYVLGSSEKMVGGDNNENNDNNKT
jgi:hypothetical protein